MRDFLVAWFVAAVAVAQQQPSPEALFDGRTLAGWRGDPAVWSVRDGCIVGSTAERPVAANTFLILDGREVADFEFTCEVRLQGDNNSGVQYRSRVLEAGAFRVGGYQCDLHAAPKYTAMLYDEQGAGIVAEHGQCVRWRDDGKQVLGTLHRPRAADLASWHRLRIVARGDWLWHEWDGVVVTAVQDQRAAAPRSGVLALQVHSGPAMTVMFRSLALRTWSDPAAAARDQPLPAAVVGSVRAAELRREQPRGETPMWVWDKEAGAEEELFCRRKFALAAMPASARLAVSCDNHCRIYVNGEKVGEGDEWESPVVVDVTKTLRAGDNVVAVHGWNEGGPAALAARLSWRLGEQDHELVTDKSWTCSNDDPDGWNSVAFTGDGFVAVRELAAMGQPGAAWSSVHGPDALGGGGDPFAPQVAVVDTVAEFVGDAARDAAPILRLLDVPRSLGSWVSLGVDPRGRLYAGAQGGGLFRITPAAAAGELSAIERVPVTIGGAHGLLWFRDALYAVVNGRGSGLYRLTDTNGDDALDRVELLQALEGEGEHGPHSVVVAPDGEHLLVVCGNHTKLPKLASSRVPTNWAEDRLLPRLEDPHKYWEGISPPGGWVCQVDPDGREWELLCCGFRNPYDIVALRGAGDMPVRDEIVVYDADMEWDMGLPWYRPTRLLGVYSGVDYGWRIGSAKWPADYPECPQSLRDLGPGSPTGMAAMQDRSGTIHILALDWTFGVVYRNGDPWVVGSPLPLCDVVVGQNATWLVTGGRGLPSSLLRLAIGDDPPRRPSFGDPTGSVMWRSPGPVVERWAEIERTPVDTWRTGALAVDTKLPAESLRGLLSLTRHGTSADLAPVLAALALFPFPAIAHVHQIAWLRVHALALLRLGPVSDVQRAVIAQRLLPLFPTGNERQDQDLAELLAYVDAPGVLDKLVPALAPMRPSPVPAWAGFGKQGDVYGSQYAGVIDAMVNAMPPIGQLAIADALRTVKHGWTLDQRRAYFTFLAAARKQKGGSSYDGFVKRMIDAAWATCSPAEQQALAELVGMAKADAPKFVATPPKGPGRDWQPGDIDAIVRGGLDGTDFARGRNLFHAASCAACHYFAGEGGSHGPDLTSLGNKFTARDVLDAILAPDQVVSEQYTGQVLTKKDGSALFGFAVKGHHGDQEVWEVMPAVADAELVRVPVADVAKVERSPRSPMPPDLVDRLSRDELRDLLAFLLSRGRAPVPAQGR